MASIEPDTLLQQRKKILNVMIETVDDAAVVDKLITNTWELLRSPSVVIEKRIKKKIKVDIPEKAETKLSFGDSPGSGGSSDRRESYQALIESEAEPEEESEPPKIMLRKKSREIVVYGKTFENIKEACKHYHKQASYQSIVKKINAGIDPETIFSLKDAPFCRKGVH